MQTSSKRLQRLSAKDGRNALIQATIACLKEYGLHDTSVRRIAEKAHVAPGLLTHHFSGKKELIAEAYRQASAELQQSFMQAVEQAGSNPLDRLLAFVYASFQPHNMDPALFKMWLGFWLMALSDDEVLKVHREGAVLYQKNISALINDVLASQQSTLEDDVVARLALGISALLDGLWMDWCLKSAEADVVRHYVTALELLSIVLKCDLTQKQIQNEQ